MRELRLGLRLYLWAMYLACVLLIIGQVGAFVAWRPHEPEIHVALLRVLVFALLAYAGERTTLRVSGAIQQSLSTAVHIAAILVFPAPSPVLITLLSVLAAQTLERKPLYKRAFNICHPTLVVGLSGSLLSLVVAPTAVLHPNHIVAALPALGLLVLLFYILDVGMLLGVLSLAQGQPPWRVWTQTYRPTLLPELAACTIGMLGAVVWQYDQLGLVLVVLPLVALRLAFRAISRAEDRAAALRQVLATGQPLRLRHTQAILLQRVAEAARTLAAAAVVTAYLRDEDDPRMLARVVLAPPDASAAGPARLLVPAAGTGLHDDVEEARRTLRVPLELEGAGVLGLLVLAGLPAALDRDGRDALAILATQAAIALENAHLHERALTQATQDGLTGLLNHRTFQTRLEEEVARSHRGGHPLALMMVDLDDFGAINNAYGHQSGDATLVAVAAALRASVRSTDVPARYGGDEFAVLLPETDLEAALAVAERVRAAIAALHVTRGGVSFRVDTSVGVAALPHHARTGEDLVRTADQAAYVAKQAGKGRVGRPEDAALALERDLDALTRQLKYANMATVQALATAVDARDPCIRGHSQRVSAYAVALARALGLAPAEVARMRLAGLLHDVGKIGVPDALLTKTGPLSEEELAVLRQHPVIGERLLVAVPFLREILPAVRHHHERWDGQGYPDRLAGEAVPLDAMIIMLADALDGMTSSRPYRPPLPVSEACRRVREGSGTQFDPRVVAAFERSMADGSLALILWRLNGADAPAMTG